MSSRPNSSNLKNKKSEIYIENLTKFEEYLLENSENQRNFSPTTKNYNNNSNSNSNNNRNNNRISTAEESNIVKKNKARQLLRNEYQKIEDETKQNIEYSIKRNSDKKAQKFYNLTNDIEKCQEFLDTVDKSLSLHDEAARNKTRRQFEEWNVNVHGRIQSEITQKVESVDYKELNRRRNQDFKNFLDITNKKPAIFRDIIIESEYDPLEPNRRSIQAKPGKLNDPTLHILQKAYDESAMLDPNSTKKSLKGVRTGRDTLDIEMWNSGKIEATPHGRFGKMMTTSDADDSIKEMKTRAQRSNVVFDHYNFPVGKEAIDKEMPVGKKPGNNAHQKGVNPIIFS